MVRAWTRLVQVKEKLICAGYMPESGVGGKEYGLSQIDSNVLLER